MLIAQLLTRNSSELDRKHQRIDARLLARSDEVSTYLETPAGWAAGDGSRVLSEKELLRSLSASALVHVYGRGPAPIISKLSSPYISSFAPAPSRWPWRKPRNPAVLIPAIGRDAIPEAVKEAYFIGKRGLPPSPTVGVLVLKKEVRRVIEQTLPRIGRLRDDVSWQFFEQAPSPVELRALSLWVDAAVDEEDGDGFTAEAIAAAVPVVASRIPINESRLERGTAGVLVKPGDANELTHAVLSALFKPEFTQERSEVARQIANRFHPDHRIARLRALYIRARSS